MIENDIVYHVHIFSELMPNVKKKFDTLKDAFGFVTSFIDRYYPLEKAIARWGKKRTMEKVSNSFNIVRIDKKLADDCRLFKEGYKSCAIDLDEFFSKKEEDISDEA